MRKYQDLGEVYYGNENFLSKMLNRYQLIAFYVVISRKVGVQIAYYAIIGTQLSMIVLSIVLILGIYTVRTFSINYFNVCL